VADEQKHIKSLESQGFMPIQVFLGGGDTATSQMKGVIEKPYNHCWEDNDDAEAVGSFHLIDTRHSRWYY